MKKTTILLFIGIFFLGCSSKVSQPAMDDIERPTTLPAQDAAPAVTKIPVNAKNFTIEDTTVPNGANIERIRVMGASTMDLLSLLSEATGESIVFQLQSETVRFDNKQKDRHDTNYYEYKQSLSDAKIHLSANRIGVGRVLERSVGNRMSVSYDDGIYYIGDVKSATIKIPSIDDLGNSIVSAIETFGASKVVYDRVTSSISFSARSKEYREIIEYLTLLRDNLYVVEYDMQIYNVNLFDEFNLGINWNAMPTADNEVGLAVQSAGTAPASTVPIGFGVIKNGSNYNASAMLHMLQNFGTVESIQRPTLLGLAGTDVTLKDGTQESYIKSFETTVVGDRGAQTSTVSATAMSGIEITLNSNILDETVVTNIAMQIDEIVGYTSFSVNDQEYRQPRVSTKQLNNTVRVEPGVPIVISGLYRQKHDSVHRGVPGTSGTWLNYIAGSEYASDVKSEMVIIVTPRIIKYVMN